jgi:hypothetical protein
VPDRFYCFEAPRDNTAHSNSVRNPLTSGGGGINVPACPGKRDGAVMTVPVCPGGAVMTVPVCPGGAVMTVPVCPGVGSDVGLDVPTCPRGMEG